MRCERLIKAYTVKLEGKAECLLEKDESEENEKNDSWNLLVNDDSSMTVTEIFDVAKSIFEQSREDEIGIINVCIFNVWFSITRDTKREIFLTRLVGDCSINYFSF